MVVALYVHGSQQTCKILCHFVPFEVESSRRWNVIVLCGSAVRKLCEDHQWCISEDEGAYFPPCFFWNVKGCNKVPNLLGNDLFKFSGDRCLPLGFEHISKSTFSRNLGLQTKNFATCFSVECLEKLRTSPKTPESWMTCRHEMAWWMGAPEGPRVCWNPLGPFAMDCMLRLNWVPWKNKWTSEALKPWSLQVLTWLYLSTRESTRSVAEASRLCGGANAPSNLTFICFYDIFVYAKELCLSEFVRSFKIAIGPRMPSFQWGTLPRSGEVFFCLRGMWHASKSKHGRTTTACYKLQSYLFTWLFVEEMQSDLWFDKVFTPVRTKSCCVTACMQDGAWLPTEAIRTVVAIASSAIVLTGVTSPYTNSGGLQSKFHAGTGSIRKSEEMCECVLMYWMLSVPPWVSSNYKLRAEQKSMSLFLALIAC